MYLFGPDELRSIHNERVGELSKDYGKPRDTKKRNDPISQLLKLFKRNNS